MREFNWLQTGQDEVNSFRTSVLSYLKRETGSLIFPSAKANQQFIVLLNLIATRIPNRSWKD